MFDVTSSTRSGGRSLGSVTTAGRRSPTKGDLREQAILATARGLLETRRLAAITIDELATGAGISRSSFYFYFDSKQAVMAALLEGLATELREENSPWLDGSGRDEDVLRQAVTATVALWRTHGGLLRQAFTGDEEQLVAWREAITERGTRRTAARIERDRHDGLAPQGPTSAIVLARMLHGLKNDLLIRREPNQSDDQLVDDLVWATLQLLYGGGPGQEP